MTNPMECPCRGWTCADVWDTAAIAAGDHHPSCQQRPADIAHHDDIVLGLLARINLLEITVASLKRQLNTVRAVRPDEGPDRDQATAGDA